jgi:methionine-rich copper-binding protein CopC
MKFKSFAAVIAAMLVLTVLSSSRVSAHAELDRSNPEAGSTVQGSPELVEIWFTEEIAEGSKIDVVDGSGAGATAAAAKLDLFDPDRKHLTVELKPNLPDGAYTVNWTSISAEDGDTESDSFIFTIEGSGTPVASPVASPGASPASSTMATPPPTNVSGSLQAQEPKAEKANIDDRALLIALGAGVLAALLIFGFWRLVKPERHPFDRNPR